MVHYYNGDDTANDHYADVDHYLAHFHFILYSYISGEIVDDPTLQDGYRYAYYAALKAEILKLILKFNNPNELVNLM